MKQLLICLAFWTIGCWTGYALKEERVQHVISVLPGDSFHDQAFSTSIAGTLALGVAGSRPPDPVIDGDMTLISIDRATGRVLAKCD